MENSKKTTRPRMVRNKEYFAELRQAEQDRAYARLRSNPNKKQDDYDARDWGYYQGY